MSKDDEIRGLLCPDGKFGMTYGEWKPGNLMSRDVSESCRFKTAEDRQRFRDHFRIYTGEPTLFGYVVWFVALREYGRTNHE